MKYALGFLLKHYALHMIHCTWCITRYALLIIHTELCIMHCKLLCIIACQKLFRTSLRYYTKSFKKYICSVGNLNWMGVCLITFDFQFFFNPQRHLFNFSTAKKLDLSKLSQDTKFCLSWTPPRGAESWHRWYRRCRTNHIWLDKIRFRWKNNLT